MKRTVREVVAAAVADRSSIAARRRSITLRAQPRPTGLVPDLIGALKATPGVLGVEAAPAR